MNDQVQAQEYWEYSRAMPSYPLQRSDVEAPRGSLVACSQFLPTPLFVPHVYGSRPDPREQHWWRVILDVAPFAPSEISLWIRDSFLKVTGEHEEKPDEYGFTARRFTRKYRIPAEADTAKMVSTLSADGILTVEVPVPQTSVPALTILPIKVETEDETGEGTGMLPGDGRAPEHPDFPAAEDKGGEVRTLEDRSYNSQLGSASTGLLQEEETFGEPAGESHPSVPADGRSTVGLQEEGPSADALKQPESEVVDEDVLIGPGEAAEEESQLGKGPQREEDWEKEDQGMKEQKQEDQGLKEKEDQGLKDQEQEDQGLEEQQKQEPEKQEQEDQEQEGQGLKDQKPEKQEEKEQEKKELETQELEDQEHKKQEPEKQRIEQDINE